MQTNKQGALLSMSLRRHGLGIVWSAGFMLFAAFIGTSLIFGAYKVPEVETFNMVVLDFYFLGLVPSLGFLMLTADYRNYFKQATFSRKLAFLKRYPISTEELVKARVVEYLLTLVVMEIIFFVPVGFVLVQSFGLQTIGEYLLFVAFWTGFSLLIGSWYLYLEMCSREKKYLLVSFLLFIPYVGIPIGMALLGTHLVQGSIWLIGNYGIVPPLLTLAAGFLSLYGFSRLMVKGVQKRDLA
ncbi:hypothetical protein [Paenibacillus sp. J31TS4]|uniref:hypothetical protein n=1 Tax=Paenibacillus sp. J31TS4 TaxID=2807195 RepID=UPI001BCA86F6|nr:hypothetical protein [Paenibacillus sp. J31TS4]